MLKKISKLLYTTFVCNRNVYAEQMEDGNYRTLNKPLLPYVIDKMLQQKSSLLTYQESNGYMKWICLDFDIDKKILDLGLQNDYTRSLIKSVTSTLKFLNENNIIPLIECSGRRGIHLWILFEEVINKSDAYKIVKHIIANSTIERGINVDLFPQSGVINHKSKGLGKGVKLPLSLHKKSGKYSFLINDISNFILNESTFPNNLSDSFISEQISLLDKSNRYSPKNIIDLFELDKKEDSEKLYISQNNIPLNTSTHNYDKDLDNILGKLSKCEALHPIVTNYQLGLSYKDREIIVGLLNRLSLNGDSEYGRSLLTILFSRMPFYKPALTQKNLERLHYYPLKCSYFKENGLCQNKTCLKQTPLDFLDISIEDNIDNVLSVSNAEFERIKESQKNYTYQNDEVPLFFTLNNIESYSYRSFVRDLNEIKNGIYSIDKLAIYKFQRIEKDKTRTLIALDAKHKILTTSAIRIINSFFYPVISSNIYGYRSARSFNNNQIFNYWIGEWEQYIKNIRFRIEDSYFDEFYIIKTDIKKFYSSIKLDRLLLKLYAEPLPIIKESIDDLPEKKYFKNIVEYLIAICKKINIEDSNTGVPQGPAFARYLANLYLVNIDNFLNNELNSDYEYYSRYVDDIFIITESKLKAERILEQLSELIISIGLEINKEKTLLMNIKEYRMSGFLEKYDNTNNYFLRSIQHNIDISSDNVIYNAISTIISTTEENLADSTWKKQNLSMLFLTLKNNEILNRKRQELENQIVLSNCYRGSFYKIFYEYYSMGNNYILNNKTAKEISGLSLTNYLNQLLINIQNSTISNTHIYNLLDCLIENPNLQNVDIELLILLYITCGKELPKKFITSSDYTPILIESFTQNTHKLITKQLSDIIINYAYDLDFDSYWNYLYTIVYVNNFKEKAIRDIASNFFLRTSELLQTRSIVAGGFNEEMWNRYYNLCCVLSCFYPQSDIENQKQYKYVWEDIITNDKAITNREWLSIVTNSLDIFNLDKCLTTIINCVEGGPFNQLDRKCYQDFIFYLLLALKQNKYQDDLDVNELMERLKELYSDDYLIQWIVDPSSELYPKDNTCILNITYNQIVILKKDSEYLVRLNDCFDYTPIKYTEFKLKDKTDLNQLYSLKFTENFYSIDEKLSNVTDRDFLDYIIQLYDIGIRLKENYCLSGYPNFFLNQTFVSSDYEPLFLFFANSNCLIDKKENIFKNNKESFCKLLINMLENKDSHFEEFENLRYAIFGFLSKEVSSVEQFSYLKKFYEFYEYDNCNGFAIANILLIKSYIKNKNLDQSFYSFLHTYLKFYEDSQFTDKKKSEISIIWGQGIDITNSFLKNRYNQVLESIRTFPIKNNKATTYIENLINNEVGEIDNILGSNMSLENYKLVDYSVEYSNDYTSESPIIIQMINKEEIIPDNTYLLEMHKLSNGFIKLEKKEDFDIIVTKKLSDIKYYVYWENKDLFIISSSQEFEKIYSLLLLRKKAYLSINNQSISNELRANEKYFHFFDT